MPALIFFVIILIAGAVIFGVRAHKQRVMAAWEMAARQLDMQIHPGSVFSNPKIMGQVDNMRIEVDTVTHSSGNNSQTFTRYRVLYPSTGVNFELHRQTGFSTITKLFGAQDVEIGDRQFDETFVIKSDDPGRVAAAITPTRRTTILQLASAFPGIRISHAKLHWEKRGVSTNPDHIVTTVRRLLGAAYVISDEAGAASALDDALKARDAGDLAGSVQQVREAGGAFRELLEVRRIEAETLAEAGDPHAAELLAGLAHELPDDEEISGWSERLAAPQPPLPVAAGPKAEPDSYDASEMASDLFGKSRLSFETSRYFDESYRGSFVRWSGTVRSAREFRRDADLGEEPGTKVVVTVARIENDLYGQTTVDAVVGLPPGNADSLKGREEVTFEGTLAKIDAMMRNVFVPDARLV